MADTSSTATTYSHTGLTAGSTRYYRVSAINSAGAGQASSSDSATTSESVSVAPDLIISAFTVGNSNPVPGQYFTLNATVKNQGNRPSSSTTLNYYRSADATITTSDSKTPTSGRPGYRSVGGLNPSDSEDKSANTRAPSWLGTYYYGACVEAVAGESDTTNNCSAAVAVTIGAAPASAPGAPTGLSATADGQTEIDLSWTAPSSDGGAAITGYKIEVSTDNSSWSDLVADTSSTTTSYSHTGLTAGTTRYYRVSAINSAGAGTASNVANATTDSAPAPTSADLRLSPGGWARSPGSPRISIQAYIHNDGPVSSAATTLRCYHSTDETITTSDTEVGSVSVAGISTSERIYTSVQCDGPWNSSSGRYYYLACVDSVPGEASIGNNCGRAIAVDVDAPPDLVVDAPTVSDSSPAADASFTLSATVRNQGDRQSGGTDLRYYRSTDSTITTSDTSVGRDWVSNLDSSESSPESISLTAPSTLRQVLLRRVCRFRNRRDRHYEQLLHRR